MTLWNDERVRELKDLWSEGKSCAEIARRFGVGFTRSSVAGKLLRMRLMGDRRPDWTKKGQSDGGWREGRRTRPAKQHAPKPTKKPKASKPPRLVAVSAEPQGILTVGLRCRWPLVEADVPGGFLFCADAREHGSYCRAHGQIAYLGCPETKRSEAA
jgi:hypothetical protein